MNRRLPRTLRFLGAAATAAALALTVTAGTATATPESADAPQVIAAAPMSLDDIRRSVDDSLRDVQLRGDQANQAFQRALAKKPKNADEVRQVIEELLQDWGLMPRPARPAPRPRQEPAPQPAPAAPASNPCPATARACVDLANQTTWLQRDGVIDYGPVPMASGKPGWETPRGMFAVNRKVKNEISYEFNNAPMPNAVYFTNNGHAFHQGSRVASHGCVRLTWDASEHYFNTLNFGDKVYIF